MIAEIGIIGFPNRKMKSFFDRKPKLNAENSANKIDRKFLPGSSINTIFPTHSTLSHAQVNNCMPASAWLATFTTNVHMLVH